MISSVLDLSRDEVEFHSLSFFDQNDRIFRWNGELYRVVDRGREALYREMFRSELVQSLVARGLIVDTELTEITLEGRMVLKHRSLPFVSYPFEWCPEMLREAALVTLELEGELEDHGLMLQDVHAYNVVFDGAKPVWVDFGSLVPLAPDQTWVAREEFVSFFVNPLRLAAAGQGRVARWLLHDRIGLPTNEVEALLPASLRSLAEASLARTARSVRRHSPVSVRRPLRRARRLTRWLGPSSEAQPGMNREAILDQLEREIRTIELTSSPGIWTDYYEWFPGLGPSSSSTPKQLSVEGVLRQLSPRTVLDIGSNQGRYSLLAANHGATVAAIDSDERAINNLYLQARSQSLPIQGVLADFRHLSMGYGPGVNFFEPVNERLGADLVLALAIVHHLVMDGLDFEQIVTAFTAFTRTALLVEFVSVEDELVTEFPDAAPDWYTFDNFVAALRAEFAEIEVLPSHPAPRVLVLCRAPIRERETNPTNSAVPL